MTFSLQVVTHVIQENLANSKSVVCSPASIDTILRILTVGAKNSTLVQLLELLGHNDVLEVNEAASKLADALKALNKEDAPTISFVNALLLDKRFSLKAEFEKVLRDVYDAHVRVVDFVNHGDKVVKEVNAWATKETKGLINEIVTRNYINDDTALLLANALYFKGIWRTPFQSKNTENSVFNLLDGHKVRVAFMNKRNVYYNYETFMNCQVISMPYQRDESSIEYYSMCIFLPNEKDGLPYLMNHIKIDENMFKDQVKLNNVKIDTLSIPKFKFESYVPLKDTMGQLGLTLPFKEKRADFSGIIDDNNEKPLYVSDIIQKCCVETNEQGTEAVAITGAKIMKGCGPPNRRPPPEIKFVADHPFMFMIREHVSGVVLFVGTMLNPKQN